MLREGVKLLPRSTAPLAGKFALECRVIESPAALDFVLVREINSIPARPVILRTKAVRPARGGIQLVHRQPADVVSLQQQQIHSFLSFQSRLLATHSLSYLRRRDEST